jgi:3-oxoacyl-[acyl-carrier-protein] synthase-1
MIKVLGYSLVSALGESANASVKTLRYHSDRIDIETVKEDVRCYKIPDTSRTDYYALIEKVARQALEQASLSTFDLDNIALFIGTSSAKLPLNEHIVCQTGAILEDLNMNEICSILSKRLGINGFSTIISTACTSSSNALIQAREMIEAGLVKHAIVLGVELYNELSIRGFDSFMLLSQDKIRPFDQNRDGVILGEALSAVVLGSGGSGDGDIELVSGAINVDIASITSPSPKSLASVMSEAISQAGISPDDIKLVKTHSTATHHNDLAEAKALHLLFDSIPHVTALKPYIGHTMGACGTNELVLLAESLKQGFVPRTINFSEADNECSVYPVSEELSVTPGYYLLNYFGFGGNNSSLVIKYSG